MERNECRSENRGIYEYEIRVEISWAPTEGAIHETPMSTATSML